MCDIFYIAHLTVRYFLYHTLNRAIWDLSALLWSKVSKWCIYACICIYIYIPTTNLILIMGFNFEVEVYFEGLLKPINSNKNLVAEDWRPIGRYFGWVFSILYSILYKECLSIIAICETIMPFVYITYTITH